MTEQAAIDGTAEEVDVDEPMPSRELVPVAQTLAVTPTVNADELVARLDVIREAQAKAMVKDVDFGVIPGTDKPTLYKPGAEKLGVLFQLDVQLENEKTWGPGDHLTVMSHATVYHAPTGSRLGYGEGVCTTRERRYAKRKAERRCPNCGKPAVIKGKAEYGGGWVCFKKKDGCGSKWPDGASEIEGQQAGEIDNPDLPDLWNTIVKMAEKRARVDAVLAVTGASALFTQDAEDQAPQEPPAAEQEPRQSGYGRPPAATEEPPHRRVLQHASGKLTGLQLVNVIREVGGAKPLNISEQDAMARLDAAVANIKREQVPALIAKIDEVAGP